MTCGGINKKLGPPRPCATCGALLIGRHGNNVYCGKACHPRRLKQATPLIDRTCALCGVTYTPTHPRQTRFCSPTCKARMDSRKTDAKRKARGIVYHCHRTCVVCGTTFLGAGGKAGSKYCSPFCRLTAHPPKQTIHESPGERHCRDCDIVIQPPKRLCHACRVVSHKDYERRYNARRPRAHHAVATRLCLGCLQPFTTNIPTKTYCGRACQKRCRGIRETLIGGTSLSILDLPAEVLTLAALYRQYHLEMQSRWQPRRRKA